jgi:large subunit ribosomal protein L10
MNREEKHQTVERLNEQFQSVNSLFLLDFRGLKVVDATDLRRRIREIEGKYFVVKNTLAKRAAQDTSVEQLAEHFEGPTAVAYHPKDVVGLAKLLSETVKSHPTMQFKAALIEGRVVETSDIQAIASMPSREVLLSRLVFLLQAPLQKLAGVLRAPLRDLTLVMKQVKK